jgi:hypothetical protein
MKDCEMTCISCFHSGDSYVQEPISGRSKAGEEVWTEDCDVLMSSVICRAEPNPKFISMHCPDYGCPDVRAEPEFHKCGMGRWWNSGRWIQLFDAEDSRG